MEALAESERGFQHGLVSVELDYISGSVHHCRTVCASTKMRFDRGANSRIDVVFEIV
jgi:hypothetical protein